MSTGPLPYDFEPTYTEEELQNRPSLDETEPDIEPPCTTTGGQNRESRRENTDWCHCDNCAVMPIVKECLCCREIRKLEWLMEDIGCITSHPDFATVCLDRAVLRATHIMRMNSRGYDGQRLRELSNRYAIYIVNININRHMKISEKNSYPRFLFPWFLYYSTSLFLAIPLYVVGGGIDVSE